MSDVPGASRGKWPEVSTSSKKRTKPHSARLQKFGVYTRFKPKENGGRLRSLNAHAEQERSEVSGNWETVRVSRHPTTVFTPNGEMQTNEEATVYVNDVDLFVTSTNHRRYASSPIAWKALRRSRIF